MKKLYNPFKGFKKTDWAIMIFSAAAICAAHFAVKSKDYLSLAASLVGAVSLIFAARGEVIAPMLMIVFAVIYGIVSYSLKYYGETIIYAVMQTPACVAAIISWFKNRGEGGTVNARTIKYIWLIPITLAAAAVATAFYFILSALGTANLIVSVISVFTSVAALTLMAMRSPLFAAAFTLNDVVLVIMWGMACRRNLGYISLTVCFCIFLLNDIYTFYCWKKRQKAEA